VQDGDSGRISGTGETTNGSEANGLVHRTPSRTRPSGTEINVLDILHLGQVVEKNCIEIRRKRGEIMDDGIGFVVVILLIIGFSYSLIKQIQHTLSIQKADKTANYKRLLLGNYLTSIAFAGFMVSFTLNISVALQTIKSSMITSNGTSISCFIFLVVLLIAKFGITPKAPKYTGLLH
jgi:hypothetical protein